MKELISLILKFDLTGLFWKQTDNSMIKFFRYCFVGGIAFVFDYACAALVFFILGNSTIPTVIGTVTGFAAGLIVNFFLSKKFVFTENANVSKKGEFIWYAIIGIVGLLISILLMLLFTKYILPSLKYVQYIAKLIVSAIVLVYNYFARKIILYSK